MILSELRELSQKLKDRYILSLHEELERIIAAMTANESVMQEVQGELYRQAELGYTAEHDKKSGLWHLYNEIANRIGILVVSDNPDAERDALKKIAAMSVAAMIAIDNGTTNQGEHA